MNYISVADAAKKWGLSERSVRNYCAEGRVDGAALVGKTWMIPDGAEKPPRKVRSDADAEGLVDVLLREKRGAVSGGIYHKLQIELTYNSNHIEGSRLTHDQTRDIFETNTVGVTGDTLNVDDVVEAANHFRCIDLVIENAANLLSESFIKELHRTLKSGTSDSRLRWFAVGDYKKLPNEVGGIETTPPEDVSREMKALLADYNSKAEKCLEDILEFHYRFERIHPFQDGNGRVGRLILFKECLRFGIVPFIIGDEMKAFYYRGLSEWRRYPGYLTDTCLSAQDRFKKYLDYFKIKY